MIWKDFSDGVLLKNLSCLNKSVATIKLAKCNDKGWRSKIEILRVSNMAGPTSAPFNTFTLYRSGVYPDENTTYIAYRPLDPDFKISLKRPTESINLFECHGSITKLVARVIAWVIKHRTEKKKVIHAHQPGVGLVTFLIAYLLIGFKVPLVYTVHNNRSNFKGLKKFAVYL